MLMLSDILAGSYSNDDSLLVTYIVAYIAYGLKQQGMALSSIEKSKHFSFSNS